MENGGIPVTMFNEDGITLWCIEHGEATRKYANGSVELFEANKNGEIGTDYTSGTVTWSVITGKNGSEIAPLMVVGEGTTLYKTYALSESDGFIPYYKNITSENTIFGVKRAMTYDYFVQVIESLVSQIPSFKYTARLGSPPKVTTTWATAYYTDLTPESYPDDDQQKILNALKADLPGSDNFDHDEVYELTIDDPEELDITANQDALYILTSMPKEYLNDAMSFEVTDVSLDDDDKKEARYNNTAIETAIWDTDIGGGSSYGETTLSYIAKKYKEFYEAVGGSDDTTAYEENLTVYSYDENGEETTLSPSDSITLDGVDCDVYEYEDTVVEVDTSSNKNYYILGPFRIDYTFDDENLDTYSTGYTVDGKTVYTKLNSIQKVTVYNQDGEELPEGSYYLTYKYDNDGNMYTYKYDNNGNLVLEQSNDKGAEITQIYNTSGTEVNDNGSGETSLEGEDVTGVVSGVENEETNNYEFYIVIDRNQIDAEDFTGYYAKFDFAYLSYIEGNLYKYTPTVSKYYYEWQNGTEYEVDYSATIHDPTGKKSHTEKYGEYTDGEGNTHDLTYTYETVVWDEYDEERTVYIPTWKAVLQYEETDINAQDLLGFKNTTAKRYYNIYSIVITSDLGEEEEPEIEITKYGENSTPLYGAVYEISMTFSGNDTYGNSVNKTVSGVYAVTDLNGQISLTTTEIEQKFGVYLGNFTGSVDVTLTEIQAPAGYQLSSDPVVAFITLEKGKISGGSGNKYEITLNDTKSNDNDAVIQIAKVNESGGAVDAYFEIHVSYQTGMYLSNGEIYLNGTLVDLQENIIRGQTTNGILNLTNANFLSMTQGFSVSGFTGAITLDIVEMKVQDGYSLKSENKDITIVLNNGQIVYYSENTDGEVLYSYFESSSSSYYGEDGTYYTETTESWAYSYLQAVSMNGNVIQIVVEDTSGTNWTIISEPPPETPNDLFMTVAGIAFLDQTETKAGANTSNGYYDSGETLLANIKVELRVGSASGSIADLYQYDESGENVVKYTQAAVTWTDENGYYEFVGVDPFGGPYYVVFTYNGVEYQVSKGGSDEYNTDGTFGNGSGWDDSSKTTTGSTSAYTTVTATTNAYDYYEIESIYEEIATIGRNYVNTNHTAPSDSYIYSQVLADHSSETEEVTKILEYISNANVTVQYTDVVPYSEFNGRFIINHSGTNDEEDTLDFAGAEDIPYIYPGQLQINIGLKETNSIDLQLLTDVVETTVSVNGYDTVYSYNTDDSGYSQYIYEEDYNYSKESETNTNIADETGVAVYKDDEMEYYITYEITVSNVAKESATALEVVDYFSKNFEWASAYTTSKGNTIYGLTINGVNASSLVSMTSSYTYSEEMIENINTYNALFINLSGYSLSNSSITVQVTFKLTNANSTLLSKIGNADTWRVMNYAEITAYHTSEGCLDTDSKPGNFSISEFEEYAEAYTTAYNSGDASTIRLLGQRMIEAREDDAWRVIMDLHTSAYHRSLSGSVWEAISDSVQTASDLQDYEGLLEYVSDHGIEGIKVELVELCDDKTEIVRACTRTDENGNYTFTNYIAGNYVVRFTYGETDRSILSDYSTTTAGDALEINGQYYQSTKANDATDDDTYWYVENTGTRYSDAYDDATSREEQINATIADAENSTSSDYDYDGVLEVQSYNHKDTIYAYTSTLNLEVEIAGDTAIKDYDSDTASDNMQRVTGNLINSYYTYDVVNVDFGLTPRALADINIDKYVSNIKIYLQDGTLQLDAYPVQYTYESGTLTSLYAGKDEDIINAISEKMGDLSTSGYTEDTVLWVYLNDEIYENSVLSTYNSNYELDGLIEVLLDEGILNGATLEVTYAITVSNDGEYDTITYYYNASGDTIAVAYYEEDYTDLTSYESSTITRVGGSKQQLTTIDSIVFHDGNSENYSYETISNTEGDFQRVTTAATNIVDYIDPNLNFVQVNYEGESINTDWELTKTDDFVSSRELDEYADVMAQYNTIIRATDDVDNYNVLLTNLYSSDVAEHIKDDEDITVATYEVGDTYNSDYYYTSVQTTLTLSKVLSTSSTGTSDYEYSNLIEITRVNNIVGRVTEIEGYDIDGEAEPETSEVRRISTITDSTDPEITPTIGTSKSEKIYRHEATGLSLSEEAKTNLGIILIALVILAGGIFLIKKFVLKPKVE